MLFIRRFAVVCLSWSKTSYPESALHLLPQRLNDEPPPTKTTQAPKIITCSASGTGHNPTGIHYDRSTAYNRQRRSARSCVSNNPDR